MKQVMRRKAADNVYLHKDFHAALSRGIAYLDEHYGEQAVRDYLRAFALSFYEPLRQTLRERGLGALREHIETLYRAEGGEVACVLSGDELVVRVEACPAVQHMRAHGQPVARLFHETTRTVNEAICEGTPFTAELLAYDTETGRSVQRFRRRSSSAGAAVAGRPA